MIMRTIHGKQVTRLINVMHDHAKARTKKAPSGICLVGHFWWKPNILTYSSKWWGKLQMAALFSCLNIRRTHFIYIKSVNSLHTELLKGIERQIDWERDGLKEINQIKGVRSLRSQFIINPKWKLLRRESIKYDLAKVSLSKQRTLEAG